MSSILRFTAQRAAPSFSRSISLSAVARKDLIQDLYVSQLKAYKPSPQAKDAAASSVRSYTAPTPPKAPALPTDLASELAKFDAEEPVIGQKAESKPAAGAETGGDGVQEYLSFLEQDLPKADKHH
ncbi:ATP synthase complex subunit H-domain-containing protein [Dioszegia hungarica]|uniref:ATP synthase complex subunit H-domain-containing protein n=1 Tax=Dioszegia hungarica TaxID=4972 RepID=A0AA38LU86_9TREE|nr:ATP synthase complex subunit H-domain-containing protein [Dioszegia hungarica]KAI9635415.1 ATP synthase complex subunit H-domain-containing protein [Dioszegia hungarica]